MTESGYNGKAVLDSLPGWRKAFREGFELANPLEVRDHFNEYFDIEMDGWVHGISAFPGEMYRELIHTTVREISPAFTQAIIHNYVFNLVELSNKFAKASQYRIHEKEVAFCILAQFPNPAQFDEDRQYVMAQIIDQVEQEWGGAIERLQKRWRVNETTLEEAA